MRKMFISCLALTSMTAFADKSEYFYFNGSHSVTIPLKHNSLINNNTFDIESLSGVKTIKLMSITPTQKMIEKNRLALA